MGPGRSLDGDDPTRHDSDVVVVLVVRNSLIDLQARGGGVGDQDVGLWTDPRSHAVLQQPMDRVDGAAVDLELAATFDRNRRTAMEQHLETEARGPWTGGADVIGRLKRLPPLDFPEGALDTP